VGVVYARTDAYLRFQGVADDELPMTVILVDLDEGVRVPGRLDSVSKDAQIGDRVRLQFAEDSHHELPRFVRE
jgi:uncharacterized OB-fold protein